MKGLSIKQISELSGVSTATVSRVINHNGRFSKETEERVLRVIEQCQYVPNMVARGLRRSSSQIVGIIVPDITNEFFARIVLKIQMQLFERILLGGHLQHQRKRAAGDQSFAVFEGAERERAHLHLQGNPSHVQPSSSLPTVFIDPAAAGCENKGYHHYRKRPTCAAVTLRGGKLAASGAQRIATIMDSRMHTAGETRFAGWKQGDGTRRAWLLIRCFRCGWRKWASGLRTRA